MREEQDAMAPFFVTEHKEKTVINIVYPHSIRVFIVLTTIWEITIF